MFRSTVSGCAGEFRQLLQIHRPLTSSRQVTDANIIEFPDPQAWRIADTSEDRNLTEIVFRIQGVLSAKDLPPIKQYP